MEILSAFLIPALMLLILIRMVLLPIRLSCKLVLHGGCGFLCLWLMNAIACFTGICIPINAVTVLLAGFLGVPGIGILLLLECIPL